MWTAAKQAPTHTEKRDVLLRMLWLLLLLAGGSLGETASPTTAPAATTSSPGTTSTSTLEDALTTNLNRIETQVTERIKKLIDDVAGRTSTEPTTDVDSTKFSDVTSTTFSDLTSTTPQAPRRSRQSKELSTNKSKKTDLIYVPQKPVGPPVFLKTSESTEENVVDLVDAVVDEARFLANHFVVEVPVYSLANATTEFIKSPRMAFGKSPFLTGFGLGFLAFGLKKLLLPIFIGAQIVKSVLVALFLPTILGHIGKLVGKGLTSVASQSGSSGGAHDQVQEFDFKDPGGGYGDVETAGSDTMSTWTMPAAAAPAPSNAHATLAALNPGRSPGTSQTAQDRPEDLISYLRGYASNIISSSQEDYDSNPFTFYQNLYGYYKNNINADYIGFNNPDPENVDTRHDPRDTGNQNNIYQTTNNFVPLRHDLNPKNWPDWYHHWYNQPSQNHNWHQPCRKWNSCHNKNYYNYRQHYDDRWFEKRYRDYYGNFKRSQQVDKYTPRLPSYQIKQHYGSFYSKDPQSDFKVFNKIPSSSQLLTHYDPFYSPLLSRLDSVFKQLGTTSEGCRERLVCDMYKNPAKFAPFSNLVSAQLSRELNELRKPSSDNPEILRFFRYMKAAKDGQDGTKCAVLHNSCIAPTVVAENASPMVTTFNDINKLVHARMLDIRK